MGCVDGGGYWKLGSLGAFVGRKFPAPVPVPGPSEAKNEHEDPYDMPSGSALSDDYVECFTEPGTPSEAESEVESATESWARGSRSEIEDFTSDEE